MLKYLKRAISILDNLMGPYFLNNNADLCHYLVFMNINFLWRLRCDSFYYDPTSKKFLQVALCFPFTVWFAFLSFVAILFPWT